MRRGNVPSRITLARLAHWRRRTRDFGISSAAFTALLIDLMLGRVQQIWVGDSHSVCFNRRFATANILRSADGVYIVHVGARLLYSISRNGLPLWSRRILRVCRFGRRNRPAFLVCFGEIDVRCHLANPDVRTDPHLEFVRDYVSVIAAVAAPLDFHPVVFVPPPPPCRDHLNLHGFPVVGTFEQRWAVFDTLRAQLVNFAAEADPSFRVIDVTPALYDKESGMASELTDDRCHTNLAGASRVRALVRSELHQG